MSEFFDKSFPRPKVGEWIGVIVVCWPDKVIPHPNMLQSLQNDLNRMSGLGLPLDTLDLTVIKTQ